MDFKILFVDDDKDILLIVEKYLSRQGYDVKVVDNGIRALDQIKQEPFDIVFTDFRMPEFDGLELLAAIKEYRPDTEVVIVTGYGTMESAIKAMKFGSYDYIQKPFKLDSLKLIIDRVIEEKKLRDENIVLRRRIKDGQRHRYDELVGMSLKMQEVYELIDKAGSSNDFILIKGESGTGKELTARVIHKRSSRKDGPFIPVNCGSVDDGEGSQSRLNQHVAGLFDAAEGGTIYLDEITEMAPSLQLSFLEFLKVGEFGKDSEVRQPLDVRIIGASKMDMEEAVENGSLRKDFFQLLNTVSIQMPPLRERKEDICLLLNHFLYKFGVKESRSIGCVSPETLDLLLDYHWPGNVIQLGNVFERAFAMGVQGIITVADLPPEIRMFGRTTKRV